jgi:hypothetical protein
VDISEKNFATAIETALHAHRNRGRNPEDYGRQLRLDPGAVLVISAS